MRRRLLLAALAGTLGFLGYAGFEAWPLAFVAFLPLLAALEGASARQALAAGAAMGLVLNLGGYHWLIGTIRDFGGFPVWLAVPFYVVLCLYQGGSFALAAWLVQRQTARGLPRILALPVAMVAAEMAWPLLFPFFMGNSLHRLTWLTQIADLGGPLLLTALLGVVNAGLFALIRPPRRSGPAVVAALALVATLAYGSARVAEIDKRSAASPAFRIGMVQTSMEIFEKDDDPAEGLRRHIEQSVALEARGKLDLLVWPESAFNYVLPPGLANARAAVERNALHTPLLFGGLRLDRAPDGSERHYNSAFLLDRDGNVLGSYDKTYLLMFGERLPFGETFPRLYEYSPHTGRFTPGSHVRPLRLGAWRLSAVVCYEDILPRFVRRALREGDPHLLVNLTNDAWFGRSVEPWIHLALAQSRAVEARRWLVRSTNSGVSAIVDPCGRVVAHTGLFTRENLAGTVRMMEGRTVYERAGDWPGWLALAVGLGSVLSGLGRPASSPRPERMRARGRSRRLAPALARPGRSDMLRRWRWRWRWRPAGARSHRCAIDRFRGPSLPASRASSWSSGRRP